MGQKRFFLAWMLFLSMLLVGAIMFYVLDGIEFVKQNDRTPITFTIIFLFTGMTIWYAICSWEIDHLVSIEWWNQKNASLESKIRKIESVTQHGSWVQSTCPTLGLLGTVLGLYLGFQNETFLTQILSGEPAEIHSQIIFIQSVKTAMFTTIAGLIAFILLSIQTHLVFHALTFKLYVRGGTGAK